ncbi:MAG: hypothetical protein CFH44_00720 [Proteobacteria bacterium]|nr:MAG: hypothetical protein CFH44_00720 [Pseudomonadota bacterium]
MNFEIWVTGAELISNYFSQVNLFGYTFILVIMILAGFSLAMQGANLSSNSYNTKMTQFAGGAMSFAGVGILGVSMLIIISVDHADSIGLINFI